MSYSLKLFLLGLLALLLAAATFVFGAEIFHAGDDPRLDWFNAQWADAGYLVPKAGQAFELTDYLAITQAPQPLDAVIYDENGIDAMAMVIQVDKGEKDNRPGVYARRPLGPGMVLLLFIDQPKIKGFLHPKALSPHAGQKVT